MPEYAHQHILILSDKELVARLIQLNLDLDVTVTSLELCSSPFRARHGDFHDFDLIIVATQSALGAHKVAQFRAWLQQRQATPVILVTGHPFQAELNELAAQILPFPFSCEELNRSIAAHIQQPHNPIRHIVPVAA